MADIINLRAVRRHKARAVEETQAAENRLKFGRTKAEKTLEKARAKLAEKTIDAHKRDE